MSEYLCFLLKDLFPEVARFALNAGISSWVRVKEAAYNTGVTEKEVIRTKCRLIADTLAYLLSFEKYQEKTLHGLWIRLRGKDIYDGPTSVGHVLIVLESDQGFILLDAYFACRGFTCRRINFQEFVDDLSYLQKRYDPEIWYRVTGCREKAVPDHVNVDVKRYSYSDDIDSIHSRFIELKGLKANFKYGHRKDHFG